MLSSGVQGNETKDPGNNKLDSSGQNRDRSLLLRMTGLLSIVALISIALAMAKIPPHATKVFSGVIFDVYHWDQELFDGRVATFEAVKRPSTVIIISVVGDRIAIAYERQPHKEHGYLTMFAGRMDAGEESLVAAQRELREESGLVSDDWELLASFSVGGKVDYQMHYFVARDCRVVGEQQLDDGGEEIEVQYMSFDEFIRFVQSEECRDVEFANMIFRMEKEGKLGDFKEKLWL